MKLAAFCLPLMLLASCGTKKQIISDGVSNKNLPHQEVKSVETERMQKLAFVQKVSDNQVYAKNITGSINFTIRMGEKKISVDGALRMRKDDVIRLQLYAPILGFEIGRLEFTPDYVLIIDNNRTLLDASIAEIGQRLKFEISNNVEGAIYYQPTINGNMVVKPNIDNVETNIDIEALFNATLCNPAAIGAIFAK